VILLQAACQSVYLALPLPYPIEILLLISSTEDLAQKPGRLYWGISPADLGLFTQGQEYAKELSRYIHLNPVRAEMVEKPEAYQWSSYPFYIGKKKAPEWLHRAFVLEYFTEKQSIA
jgi:hypothetical protein